MILWHNETFWQERLMVEYKNLTKTTSKPYNYLGHTILLSTICQTPGYQVVHC